MAGILRLLPAICAYLDSACEDLNIEIVLPEAEKKNVSFKIMKDGSCVKATRWNGVTGNLQGAVW